MIFKCYYVIVMNTCINCDSIYNTISSNDNSLFICLNNDCKSFRCIKSKCVKCASFNDFQSKKCIECDHPKCNRCFDKLTESNYNFIDNYNKSDIIKNAICTYNINTENLCINCFKNSFHDILSSYTNRLIIMYEINDILSYDDNHKIYSLLNNLIICNENTYNNHTKKRKIYAYDEDEIDYNKNLKGFVVPDDYVEYIDDESDNDNLYYDDDESDHDYSSDSDSEINIDEVDYKNHKSYSNCNICNKWFYKRCNNLVYLTCNKKECILKALDIHKKNPEKYIKIMVSNQKDGVILKGYYDKYRIYHKNNKPGKTLFYNPYIKNTKYNY